MIEDDVTLEIECARAEGAVFRDGIIGAVIGASILAPIWALLVLFALRDSGTAMWPPALRAAGVGAIAGIFMGGRAGTLVGSRTLEEFEYETRPPLPG